MPQMNNRATGAGEPCRSIRNIQTHRARDMTASGSPLSLVRMSGKNSLKSTGSPVGRLGQRDLTRINLRVRSHDLFLFFFLRPVVVGAKRTVCEDTRSNCRPFYVLSQHYTLRGSTMITSGVYLSTLKWVGERNLFSPKAEPACWEKTG